MLFKKIKELRPDDVQWKELGEVCEFYGGLTGKKKYYFERGNAPYVTYKNIFSNIEVNPKELENVYIQNGERQHCIKYVDILITGSSENKEDVGLSSAVTFFSKNPIYLNSFSFGIRFQEELLLIPEFAKHLFRSEAIRRQIRKTAKGVTGFNISKTDLKKKKILIPPLEIQQKIAHTWGNLDAFCQHLNIELPKNQPTTANKSLLTYHNNERTQQHTK